MTGRRAALLALALAAAAASPAAAAIPASGRVIEGIGASAVPIGIPKATAVARWHLVCPRPNGGNLATRCYSSLHRAINWVEINGAGRVEGLVWGEGGWRTTKGIGLGARIGAVRAAYGRSLNFRANRTWTYMSVRRTVKGQVRVTGFLGRTKVGDVVQMYVTRERRRLIASVPGPGGGATVTLTDWYPRERIDSELRLPWERSFGTDLATVRTDDRGNARIVVAIAGEVARALARRPAGTTGPVTARLVVGGSGGRVLKVPLALPAAAPTLALAPATVPPGGDATLTVAGAEAGAEYEVDAEWTCPATGAVGRERSLQDDPLYSLAGGTLTAALRLSPVGSGLFDEACAGASSPDVLPATLVLVRIGQGRGSASDSRERVATLAVAVARP